MLNILRRRYWYFGISMLVMIPGILAVAMWGIPLAIDFTGGSKLEIKIEGDINTLNHTDIPEADLWCGGFPCQDLSLANQGKRKGLNGSRSGLFFKFYKLLSERRPNWIIIENGFTPLIKRSTY